MFAWKNLLILVLVIPGFLGCTLLADDRTQFVYQPAKGEPIYVDEVRPLGKGVSPGALALGDKTLVLGHKYAFPDEMTIVWKKINENKVEDKQYSTKVSIKNIPKEKRTNHIIFEYQGDEKWTVRFGKPVK
ncbi:MAG: hypothetical protein MPJ24_07530 [Pirellulaceae bacterium]|nr:hypothetical protein [Pirellulaceae bacterium]